MQIGHRHIQQQTRKQKRQANISKESPLLVILSKRLTFLNKTIISILQHHQYEFRIIDEGMNQLMGYALPIICFQDVVLEKDMIVQFLSDICFSQYDIREYLQRKQNMLKMYQGWNQVLKEQTSRSFSIREKVQRLQRVHNNKVFEEFLKVKMQVIEKGYEKLFQNYKSNEWSLQSVFIAYVTETILQELPKMPSDFALRAYFTKQIDFKENYKQIIKRQNKEKQGVLKIILLDQKQLNMPAHPNFYLNWKWFAGFFTVFTGIFIKWSK